MSYRHYQATDRTLFVTLILLLLWLPLPYGSNVLWAGALLEILTFLIAIGWLFAYIRKRVWITPAFWAARHGLLLWILWTLFIGLQLIPLPADWVALLSPIAYHRHQQVVSLFGQSHTTFYLSLDPGSTLTRLLTTIAYGLLFCLTLLLVNSRTRLRILAMALLLSGLGQALYGLLELYSGWDYQVNGSFVNYNHLAGYLGLCMAMGLGLLLADLQSWEDLLTWRQRLRHGIRVLFSLKILVRGFLVIMVIALVMTRSRMGNTAFFTSMMVCGLIYIFFKRREIGKPALTLFISLMIIDLWVISAWFGLDQLVERIRTTDLARESRDEVIRDSGSMLADYRLTGTGLGSYYAVFPYYRGSDVQGFYDHAHNDYAEFFSEVGVVGSTILASLVLLAGWTALQAIRIRKDRLQAAMGFSSLMAMVTIAIHSTTDFNLQIPSNAATLVVIMALAWVARVHGRNRRHHRHRLRRGTFD